MPKFNTPPPKKNQVKLYHPVSKEKTKKFVETNKKLSNTNSMYGVICKRSFVLLFCKAGNPVIARNYQYPGSCKKAWATEFERGK